MAIGKGLGYFDEAQVTNRQDLDGSDEALATYLKGFFFAPTCSLCLSPLLRKLGQHFSDDFDSDPTTNLRNQCQKIEVKVQFHFFLLRFRKVIDEERPSRLENIAIGKMWAWIFSDLGKEMGKT